MSMTTLIFLTAGLVLLVLGAEILVRGASRLASLVGLSPLVIGLTIVAYGTSSPELAVSILSNLRGQAGIALGNVIGSNIFNILAILGLCALVAPLVVAQQLIRLDVPIMLGVSLLTWMFCLDGKLSRVDGTILFIGALLYTAFLISESRKESNPEVQEEYAREYSFSDPHLRRQSLIQLGSIAAGLGLLLLGSRWLLDSATEMARAWGVNELIIGLTIVAAGTSLPELATSAVASFRGERDIAVGNAIGSNIFNILGVLGLSALFSPAGISVSQSALRFDIPVMVGVAAICLPVFFTGKLISRWEGFLLVGYYLAYTTYLIVDVTAHESLPLFSRAIGLLVVLTLFPLGVATFEAMSRRRPPRH